MPMSKDFKKHLYPKLPDIVKHFGTPFHIYDEKGIIQTGEEVKNYFEVLRFLEKK
ncbi:hypothetical protein KKH86_01845 [Patescibacteria group bacterium]|nr:hypothetical protein [Patescibacteria group bacterium]